MAVNVSATKSERIRKSLVEALAMKKFARGDQFYTEEELCDKYNVSRPTIRQALQFLEEEGYLTRHQGKGTFVDSIPTERVATGAKHICLVYRKSWRELPGDVALEHLIRGVEEAATLNSFFLQLIMLDEFEEANQRKITMALEAGHVAGIVWMQAPPAWAIPLLEGVPTVLEGNVEVNGFPSISRNTVNGSFMAVEHLLKLGHRKIGLIASNITEGIQFEDFVTGYKRAYEKYSVDGDYRHVLRGVFDEDGYTLAKDLLESDNPPTAIFGTEWITVAGIFRAADELGLKVPDDLSVVGYGDNAVSWQHSPKLTVIGFSTQEAGRVAAETLLGKIKGSDGPFKSVVLPVKLINGETTREVNGAGIVDRQGS
jgi:DNA-binding LacI/PurR family transcriptional regulator